MTQAQDPKSPAIGAPDNQDGAAAKKTTAKKAPRKAASPPKKTAPNTASESPAEAPARPARGRAAAKPAEKKSAAKTADKAETPKAKASAKKPAAKAAAKTKAEKPAKAPVAKAAAKTAEQSAASETAPKAAPKSRRVAPKKAAAAPKKAAAEQAKDAVSSAPEAATARPAPEQAPADAQAAAAPEKKSSRFGQRGRSRGGKSTAALEVPEHVNTRSPGTPNGVATWQAPGSLIAAAPETPKPSERAPEPAAPTRTEVPAASPVETQASAASPAEGDAPVEGSAAEGEAVPAKKRKRSRRGGRRKKKAAALAAVQAGEASASPGASTADAQADALPEESPDQAEDQVSEPAPSQPAKKGGGSKKQNQRGRGKAAAAASPASPASEDEEEPEEEFEEDARPGKRKMFVSVLAGEQVEVVLAEEGMVQEYYVEMLHQAKVKGNIYKGVVSNVDPNLQAAFVNYGGVKNGFLQIDEVHPEYYLVPHDSAKSRKFPLIQKALKPGQEILVQVVKEPAGTKGAFLTSYLSLPGRFLVLTPGREQIGVSRKVEKEDERARLREMLQGLTPGKGLGVIVRTVSMGASKTSLQRDLQFLKRLWKEVRAKGQKAPTPSLIYQELALSTRAVRDYLTDDVQELWVDDEATARMVEDMASLLFPRKQNLVRAHTEAASLFERFNLQKQLDQIHSREVVLPSGGRLVFDNTEALTAIDINSGRSGGKSNFEDMAYRTNLEAARMIPLQLRLRDIGGQVVADFIEMRDRDHWREVEKALRAGMKGDRARYDVGKVGPFGMLEMVRQRLGSSAISVSTEPCPCCKGTGVRRNMEWQAMQALREIQRLVRQAAAQKQTEVSFPAERELALHLLNTKRQVLLNLETQTGVHIAISTSAE